MGLGQVFRSLGWLVIGLAFAVHSQEQELDITKLDCSMRNLALEYASQLLKKHPQQSMIIHQVQDALRIDTLCDSVWVQDGLHDAFPFSDGIQESRQTEEVETQHPSDDCPSNARCVYVAPKKHGTASSLRPGGALDGSWDRPFFNLHQGLRHIQELRQQFATNSTSDEHTYHLVLRDGTHHLKHAIQLGKHDSGLLLRNCAGESATISGSIALPSNLNWKPCGKECRQKGVMVANLKEILADYDVPDVPSLFTTQRRYTRARYPNGDPELNQWGYASYDRQKYSIDADRVVEWHRPIPEPSNLPSFTYVDFRFNPPEGVPVKNDSAQSDYNIFASGRGGICSSVWGENSDSYWCSNASSGGWAEVDQECATTGQLGIPVGLTYNVTMDEGKRFQQMNLTGGIIHAWHSQSWAMHMFAITDHFANSSLRFAAGGGRQGGRSWCRCDQCTYAGAWCGQHESPPRNNDTRLISGSWMIENVLDELDHPGEFFLDPISHLLHVFPNVTSDLNDFHLALHERLIEIRDDATNITIQGIHFKHTKATYMGTKWSPPSGGDWSLYRGGAIFMEQVSNIVIRDCFFHRLDGNAVFLSGRTRHVVIKRNIFEWLGENAVATWGNTDVYDATAGNFPVNTLIEGNVMREIGIFQKQSSGIGQCKAALSKIRGNIMFNMPRAAINFNDMVGGGDVVEHNLIFNTCRESGDHGPINSWDRQPFLTTLRDGVTRSFDPISRKIRSNFIFANYGASQGVDNDDGSSWYQISRNVFYMAEGFKMDYGGHDSTFEHNLILSFPYDGSQCFNVAGFLEGHGDRFRNNTCVVGLGRHKLDSGCGDPSCASKIPDNDASLELVGMYWGPCAGGHFMTANSSYYTPHGNASIRCEDTTYPLREVQQMFSMDIHSTHDKIPDEEHVMVDWARTILFPKHA